VPAGADGEDCIACGEGFEGKGDSGRAPGGEDAVRVSDEVAGVVGIEGVVIR
jgi:hypothetical protein